MLRTRPVEPDLLRQVRQQEHGAAQEAGECGAQCSRLGIERAHFRWEEPSERRKTDFVRNRSRIHSQHTRTRNAHTHSHMHSGPRILWPKRSLAHLTHPHTHPRTPVLQPGKILPSARIHRTHTSLTHTFTPTHTCVAAWEDSPLSARRGAGVPRHEGAARPRRPRPQDARALRGRQVSQGGVRQVRAGRGGTERLGWVFVWLVTVHGWS